MFEGGILVTEEELGKVILAKAVAAAGNGPFKIVFQYFWQIYYGMRIGFELAEKEDVIGEKQIEWCECRKVKTFLWIWTIVDSYESAVVAAKRAWMASFYLVFICGFSIYTLFDVGLGVYGIIPSNSFELTTHYTVSFIILLMSLWMGLRMRQAEFKLLPVVALFAVIDVILNTLLDPALETILINILIIVFITNSVLGWKYLQWIASDTKQVKLIFFNRIQI